MNGDTERERLQAILEFWHRIEFFIPFDLSARAEPEEGRVAFWLHAQTLEDDAAGARRPTIPEGKEVAGFKIFFGVFEKSEMAEVLRRFCAPTDEFAAFEDRQRGDLEGDTCFASLDLDSAGNPLFDRFSVSTLPWALGCISKGNLSALSSGAFADSKRRLTELLGNFAAQRQLDRSADTVGDQPLAAAEILSLNDLLQDWAGFTPRQGRPAALVEVRFRDKRRTPATPQLEPPGNAETPPDDDGEEDEDADVEHEIGILNSFYLEDLERAIAIVRGGDVPETLRQYLTPVADEGRLDLYSEAGRAALLEALHPRHVNRGRWPSEPHHAMSLMQQFAINAAGSLDDGGLFSVNGPPGTGKTTLLRDVIADNVVKRARMLAELPHPQSAFQGRSKTISFADGTTASISILIPGLTGFEMVVASSNNTAVENISRDLPKRSSISGASSLDYLQTVAHKVAAQTKKGTFEKLEGEKRPWGLIPCVLGNAKNRRAFINAFAYKPAGGGGHTIRRAGNTFETVWGWVNSYRGPSFAEAAKAFRSADSAVDAGIGDYERYADLFAETGFGSREDFCRDASLRMGRSADDLQAAQRAHDAALDEMRALELRLSELKEQERLFDRASPAWWYGLFPTKAGRSHRESKAENAQAQIAASGRLLHLKGALKELRSALEQAAAKHEECKAGHQARQRAWDQKRGALRQLEQVLGEPAVPEALSDLETDRFQIAGLWHSDELASRRSALFEAALRLHAAWLAEVAQKGGGFGGNIVAANKLLSGNIPVNPETVPVIWQGFFMIVPVVSTTFASFSRQFDGLGAGEIGWLFIDEAGQAVPQAAVGALMRARRAVVIGDPLQIEPVFTLPAAFIEALAGLSPHTEGGEYAPLRASTQTLADAANRFGTAIPADGEQKLWIGSPLRVHRRCCDPMFSLANRIAYGGKMVYGAGNPAPSADVAPYYGDSAWIDIRGRVAGKQTVPEQVAFVAEVVTASFRRDAGLPDIYVITPFKETKSALKREIERATWIGPDGAPVPRPKNLAGWLKERVGTVHTFQGKEENAVFMVLGTDAARHGAAQWAASKPNILNVAVTRARHQIFIVGDRDLWCGLPHFSEAAHVLRPMSAAEFLMRIGPARRLPFRAIIS
ncbi:DEAD/DEAH box helicase [Sinorhizobium meliloti]|uniref:DEAD/DEAH box helicase n=2 Tax=Rhizobium meliloti TaxID=382 RepID=UPI003D65DA39